MQDYDPLAVVNELLRHRGDPSARDADGKTALHFASSIRTKLGQEMAFTLMREPSLLHLPDNRSSTPIHSASQNGQVQVVLALLDNGVDVNSRGFSGSTPLHLSVSTLLLCCCYLWRIGFSVANPAVKQRNWATFDQRKTCALRFGEKSATRIPKGVDLALRFDLFVLFFVGNTDRIIIIIKCKPQSLILPCD